MIPSLMSFSEYLLKMGGILSTFSYIKGWVNLGWSSSLCPYRLHLKKPIADHVNDNVFLELLPPQERDFEGFVHLFRLVSVDVNDGRLHSLRDFRAPVALHKQYLIWS